MPPIIWQFLNQTSLIGLLLIVVADPPGLITSGCVVRGNPVAMG